MRYAKLRDPKTAPFLAAALALGGVLVGPGLRAHAAQGPECEVAIQGANQKTITDGSTLQCNDCDANCDEDGVTTANKSCTFMLQSCANQTGEGCPVNLKRKIKGKGQCGAGRLGIAGPGMNSACGLPVPIKVKTTKKGMKAGKCKIQVIASSSDKPSKVDVDKLTLVCNPAGATCPAKTTTTTTTPATTTTTTQPPCADPNPNCCPSGNTMLKFTTGTPSIGGGGCGTVKDGSGTTLIRLDCGGLYTGGGGGSLPLPSVVPDMGSSFTKVGSCSGTDFVISATSPTDTGTHRDCTSAGVADPDYKACVGGANDGKPCVADSDCPTGTCSGTMPGCLFGPPLPIPNASFIGASVCVINRVAGSASGSGNCKTGSTAIDLPLSSDLYLTGDLLDGSAPDRPDVPGIQPCPICDPGTSTCKGGPKNGMACTPGDTAGLAGSSAYPTSHDCPPPPGPQSANYIGALPIPFGLTTDPTGTDPKAHKVASNMNGQEVFCGFCGAAFSPTFKNPPVPCTSNTQCAGLTGCPGATACGTCKQRDSGAFGTASLSPGAEHEITLTGSPASGGCLTDMQPHPSTLVSAFCIPPAFNATVDANGDLPGPGAVSLPGMARLIP